MAGAVQSSLQELLKHAQTHQAEINIQPDDTGVGITHRPSQLHFHHSLMGKAWIRRAHQSDQALLKACRNRQRSIHHILDTTAGWGLDGLILAHQGQFVTWLEKEPLIHAILNYSLAQFKARPENAKIAERLALLPINATEYLRTLPDDAKFDCILIDPMFPEHKSSAKASKPMQILQALTENQEIDTCIDLAMQKASKRVVIKRPLKAPALTARKTDMCYWEKTIRFDVYLTG